MRTVTSKHVSPLAITGWIAATLLAAALFTAPVLAFADEDAQPSIDDTAAMNIEDAASYGESGVPEESEAADEEPAADNDADANETDASGADASGAATAAAAPSAPVAPAEEAPAATALEEESAEASADETATADETAPAEDPEATTGADATSYQNMYRLYNPHTGEHFYTADFDEAMAVAEAGWQYEGVGWVAPASSGTPVYRLYNGFAGDHHYTLSEEERDALVAEGWAFEGIGWYSDESESALAVLRQYNPNAEAGAHNFTLSAEENAQLVAAGWDYEGVAWYAADRAALPIEGRWLVTSAWGTLERYWLGTDAQIAKERLITPDEGAGYYAYATSDGSVACHKYIRLDGTTYRADDDGSLTEAATRFYLDAGHVTGVGGVYDSGAVGSGYREADLTTELVGLVADIARSKYGLDVVLNGSISYKQRQQEAWAAGATALVSIHFNSGSSSASGSESYIHTYNSADGSAELQDIMHAQLVKGMGLFDRGQRQAAFAVTGGSVPAVLMEVCFVSNSNDMAQYQARKVYLAECLAAGLYEYSLR